MDAIQRAFAALLPDRAGESLTDWEKGILIVEHFSINRVSEEDVLESLVALLLTITPSSPDSFASYVNRISGLVEELVGQSRLDEADLEDIRGRLMEGKSVREIRQMIAARRTMAA